MDIHLICHHCCTSVQKGGQNRLQVFHSMNCSSFRIFILDSQEAHFRKRRINQATKRSSVPSWHIAIRCCREATLSCGISQQDLSCECHGGSLSDRISVYGWYMKREMTKQTISNSASSFFRKQTMTLNILSTSKINNLNNLNRDVRTRNFWMSITKLPHVQIVYSFASWSHDSRNTAWLHP